ncbi:MAG: YhcH/YjgK/YiaL family protein [Planctomycetota bacterium]
MIYDRLKQADDYAALHPLLAEAFAFLRGFDPATPEGRVTLRGDDLFVNVERYATEPAGDRRYESHRRYLDVQAIFAGRETIYVEPVSGLEVAEPYDGERDAAFYRGPDRNLVALRPGEFALFFPQDGHKPCCQTQAPSEVLKAVAKIRIDAAGD